ncbi:sensor histidine kinase [Mongoliimonas terrestris]|uniref:ATP-binding protein n=1 Tax=Mongoliimonas terrestris TaxID=1709001 RepID=UPI000A61CD60|nr:HAMP domain-containing sensor histidine kinase [Mongoliimonas terrestris]
MAETPTLAGRLASVLTAERSLAFRLVVSAVAWSAVSLAVAGLLLTQLYRDSLERAFDARLAVYQKTLAGAVAVAPEGEPPAFDNAGEPRFNLPLSGWYWMVRDARTGQVTAASRSLFGELLDVAEPPPDGSVIGGYVPGPLSYELRLVAQRVRLIGDRNLDVIVAGNADELKADIASFRNRVFATLIVFAVGLVLATILQVRLGLRPLTTMRDNLKAIREGQATRLSGGLPREIAPLAEELNALIETNGAIVERARGHVGNLAHALKTPLSVMLNEARAENGPLGAKVADLVGVMRSEVDRYLDRARMAAERRVVGAAAEPRRAIDGVAAVLRRAYADRDLAIETTGPADLKVRVERRDLDELVGNLMDNAAKFGRGTVRASVEAAPDDGSARPMVAIMVEDDGPGLTEAEAKVVLARGRRLDESVPGSGLGLSIVDELVEAYGGRIGFSASDLGGLKVTVRLPQS